MALREAWDENAADWIEWARSPARDHPYWRFNRPRFLELLPPPGRLTLDVGSGEGRLTRELARLGHTVVGVETSPALAAAAAEDGLEILLADAAALPIGDGAADLAVAFMSLLNMDDVGGVVREVARVLAPGGRFCFAVPHPANSAGLVDGAAAEADYFATRPIVDVRERDGVRMTFHDVHRPLEAYSHALEAAGLLVEAIREPVPPPDYVREHPSARRWLTLPCFLHVRALRPAIDHRRGPAVADEELVERARHAMRNAYAPYSGFAVGAAVRSRSGAVHVGANVENAAYPQGQCAEASALGAMVSAGERELIAVAVIADGDALVTPCGGCRQRLRELGSPATPVHLCGPEGVRHTVTLGELLPLSFGPSHLSG
jgi:homotetrameric cytidine deaminase